MDQESRDANSQLVILDQGLQSQNIGDQSEAVARFTSLFLRYPLPILIDSACLKLSEAFKNGSNFIRVQICEVLERNQSHLNKIYNVDVFYRNLFTVTTSNDPIARSITLLALGNIAPIVSGHKTIHHCISNSLDSSIECELNAAIVCAACYVKQSSEFACNIYPKIVSIIDSSKSSTEIKIKALSVLDHGFYNAHDAMTVRSFLIDVMSKSKLRRIISICLTLSTKIAYSSLSYIMPQIDLLLGMFLNEPHLVIKLTALSNLRFLAEKSPHIWDSTHVDPLVSHLESSFDGSDNVYNERCLYIILSIFCKLLTCKCNFISQQEKARIFQQCYKLSMDNGNARLCSMAFELLTVMSEEHFYSSSKNINEYKTSDLTLDTFAAVKNFLTNSTSIRAKSAKNKIEPAQQESRTTFSSKTIYRHIVELTRLNTHYAPDLIKLIFNKISHKETPLAELCPYVTELLCAILQTTSTPIITPENCWKLIKNRSSDMSEANLMNVCVLYFQTLRLTPDQELVEGLVDKVTDNQSLWFGFKVMRQAMRFGHHKIAGLICNRLHEHVSTDITDFYFKSLGRICCAESILASRNQISIDLDENLKAALPLYEDAVSPLRASIGNSQFQLQFLWLRIRNLQAHSTLRQCCKIYEISPVTYATLISAINATRGNAESGLSRLGVIQQMPKIAKDFRQLGQCYKNLASVSFNCDTRTLDYIHLLRCSCIIMADAIDAIFQYGRNLPIINKVTTENDGDLALEHRGLETTCNKLIEMTKTEIVKPGIQASSESIKPLIVLLKNFSDEILKCPFVYPRYFFQPLQTTQVKLAITPQPASSSSSVMLTPNSNLVLKVEGLVQNRSKRQLVIREVSKVVISVSMNSNKPQEPNVSHHFMQSTATPHNNYFKTEFLLPMKICGTFIIDIEVSIIDEKERLWKTGPTEHLSVSVS